MSPQVVLALTLRPEDAGWCQFNLSPEQSERVVAALPEILSAFPHLRSNKPRWQTGCAPWANKQFPWVVMRNGLAQGYFFTEGDADAALMAMRAARGEQA